MDRREEEKGRREKDILPSVEYVISIPKLVNKG